MLFDRVRTPEVEIGEAVAASVAIPGFFRPARIASYAMDAAGRHVRGHRFADGGLVSNLPVHVFLEEKQAYERRNPADGRVPVVAFSLADPPGPVAVSTSLIDYAAALARTAIFGGQAVGRELVPDLVMIPLDAPLGVLQFDAGWEAIRGAYKAGLRSGFAGIQRAPALRNRVVADELARLVEEARVRLDAVETAQGRPGMTHLRAYILAPVGVHSLRVTYGVHMEGDADDRLTLDREGSGLAAAYQDRASVVGGESLLDRSMMTKYERAMVRRRVKSWACVPIYPDAAVLDRAVGDRPEPLGVLIIDSDTCLHDFIQDAGRAMSATTAEFVGWMEREAVTLAVALEGS